LEAIVKFCLGHYTGTTVTCSRFQDEGKGIIPGLLQGSCGWYVGQLEWRFSADTGDLETLFSSTASPNRKYWGFQVFQKALKRADEEAVPMLFTKNFMRTWINHLSKKDRYLHKVSLQTVCPIYITMRLI